MEIQKYSDYNCHEIVSSLVHEYGVTRGFNFSGIDLGTIAQESVSLLIAMRRLLLDKIANGDNGTIYSLCSLVVLTGRSYSEDVQWYVTGLIESTANYHNTGPIEYTRIWNIDDYQSRMNWLNAMIEYHNDDLIKLQIKKLIHEHKKSNTANNKG